MRDLSVTMGSVSWILLAVACGDTTINPGPGAAGTGGTAAAGGSSSGGGAGGIGGTSAAGGSGGSVETGGTGGAGGTTATGGTAGSNPGGNGGSGGSTVEGSCQAILTKDPTAASGVYEIDPDGPDGQAPRSAYCDMDTKQGGWTLCLSSRYTADADALFLPHYNPVPDPDGDPLGYYDLCPQDRSEYIAAVRSINAGTFGPAVAALYVQNAAPLHEPAPSAAEGVYASLSDTEWITLPTDMEPVRYWTSAEQVNEVQIVFWASADPTGDKAIKFRGAVTTMNPQNGNQQLKMLAGCQYTDCTSPATYDDHVNPTAGTAAFRLGAGIGTVDWGAGGGWTAVHTGDRVMVFYR